jgi:hypothetical protein
MVVITLIAILSGVVLFTVNFNSDKRHVQTTARQLQQLTQAATDEALQLDRLLGIELFTDGYRFLEWVEPEQEQQADQLDKANLATGDVSPNMVVNQASATPAPLQGGYWDLLQGDKFLKQQRFNDQDDVVVELEMAGNRIELLPMETAQRAEQQKKGSSFDKNKKPQTQYLPHLIFSPSGETTDFELIIAAKDDDDYQFMLRGDVLGQLTLQAPGEENQ